LRQEHARALPEAEDLRAGLSQNVRCARWGRPLFVGGDFWGDEPIGQRSVAQDLTGEGLALRWRKWVVRAATLAA
jgi:hypothetical protein